MVTNVEKEIEIFYPHTLKFYNIKTIIKKMYFVDLVANEFAERKTYQMNLLNVIFHNTMKYKGS